ncbi:ankyrin repeat domain-containing protein [Deinococcus arenicola]|uniref:Ankyrin repeat domain-containing protein n=1 Tax=Deinococcus arenicola TaxID=2994950 RepID=A0ABU4DL30_9DEIO|nr:ankyrin repeat domain-containing protein [Deinococcus sp. ZS9-10]MDV6373149.1 ankyrin repeat domain-containing protein [Deinococcus sp. ZS9-10]
MKLSRRVMIGLALLGSLSPLLGSCQARGSAKGVPVGISQSDQNVQLLQAVQNGDLAKVQALLKAGASAKAAADSGRTALTWATKGDHVAVARALIAAGADPDPQDDQRSNALLVTGETGSVAMLREVLKAIPDLTRTNRYGGTALIPAADRGHLPYVREILKTTRIKVNHVNNLGWTALLEAVILGDGGPTHTEIVRELLAHGADRKIADRDGVTPLQHARQRGYGAMVKLLEK